MTQLFSRRHYEYVAEHCALHSNPSLTSAAIRIFQSADPETFSETRFRGRVEFHQRLRGLATVVVLPLWQGSQWGAD